MAADPPLPFTCRIQQRTLNEQESLAYPRCPLVLACSIIHCLFKFITENSVWVDCRWKNEVCCFLFYLNVAIGLELVKAMRKSDSKNCFPSNFPCKVVIKLVGKLKTICPCGELGVVVTVATASTWDIAECFQVFVSLFYAPCKIKKIEGNLTVSELCPCVLEEVIRGLP